MASLPRWRRARRPAVGLVCALVVTLAGVACTSGPYYCGQDISGRHTDVMGVRPATGEVVWQVTTEPLAYQRSYDQASGVVSFLPLSPRSSTVALHVADGSRAPGMPRPDGFTIITTTTTLVASGVTVSRDSTPGGGYELVGTDESGTVLWRLPLPRAGGGTQLEAGPDLVVVTSSDNYPTCD